MKTTRWALTACAAAGLAGAALPGAASAAPSYAVVADDLNNPRGLTVAPDGSVYVAEAGRAGRTCLDEQKSICLAPSGAVTRLSGATKRRVVRGLTSVGGRDGRFAVGADGVAVTPNGTIYVAMTAAANCAPTRGLPERARRQVGRLLKARPGGRLRSVANLNELECRTNPDGGDRNSNPYAVLALGGDHEVVVDAGANALWDVRGRRARVLATFPTKKGRQSAPTSIALGPDGAYYVGELGEGRGTGGARVFRVEPGKAPTVYRTGFTSITGLAFGPDGSLFVTQFANRAGSRQASGAVIRVAPDGTRTRLGVGRLFFPSGAAVGADGSIYVSNWSVLPASTPRNSPFKGAGGQVVRITL